MNEKKEKDDFAKVIKILGAILLSVFFAFVFLLCFFQSLPRLLISDALGSVNEKVQEWNVVRATDTVNKSFNSLHKDISKEIIGNIEDGYINKYKKKVKEYWENGNPQTIKNNTFSINREKDTDNILAYQYFKDRNADMYTMVRYKGYNSKETTFNAIDFISYYSVWHQDHDVGSDDTYKESDDPVKRWTSFGRAGMKRFIRKHKDELIKVKYEYTNEYIETEVEVNDSMSGSTKETVKTPVRVLNVSVAVATEDEIKAMFELDDEQADYAKTYAQIANALYENLQDEDGEVINFNVSFEPTVNILDDVFGLGSHDYKEADEDDVVVSKSAGSLNPSDYVYKSQIGDGSSYGSGTVWGAGCGCCSTYMAIHNLIKDNTSFTTLKNGMVGCGAGGSGGTTMSTAKGYLERSYPIKITHVSDSDPNREEKLKNHLKKGYTAVLHVGDHGASSLFSKHGGHFVCAAGIIEAKYPHNERIIILDPSASSSKYSRNVWDKYRSKLTVKQSSGKYVVACPFSAVDYDRRFQGYFLFTPTKDAKVKVSKSASEIKKEKEEKKKKEKEKKKKAKEQKKNKKTKVQGIKSKVYVNIRALPVFPHKLTYEKTTKKPFDGKVSKILKELNEEWDRKHNVQTGTIPGTTGSGNGMLSYPTSYRRISAGYPNYSSGRYHGGVDWPCPLKTAVRAAADGTVILARNLNYSYGHYLIIDHGNGLSTLYAHNTTLLVGVGDHVNRGQQIALSGSTGNSTGPHCHFEVRVNGTRVNPLNYLSDTPYYTPSQFKSAGVYNISPHRWTWYSSNEVGQTVTARSIPGKHLDPSTGYWLDKDGYLCLAAKMYPYYTVIDTPFGRKGKVYDTFNRHPYNTIDVYTNWPV